MNRRLLLWLSTFLPWFCVASLGLSDSVAKSDQIASLMQFLDSDPLRVTVMQEHGKTLVRWYRPENEDILYFVVERRNENSDFYSIGGLNINASNEIFVFEDMRDEKTATMQYRVRAHLRDGSSFVSNTYSVYLSDNQKITIVHNPETSSFDLSVSVPLHQATLTIIDMRGNVVQRSSWSGTTGSVSMAVLPRGHYKVRIQQGQALWQGSLSHI